MGKIFLYKGLGNSHEQIEGNGSLSALLPSEDFNRLLVLKKGCRVSPDYIVEPDDILFARRVSGAVSTATGLLLMGLWVGAWGIFGGVVESKKRARELKEVQENAQQNAENLANKVTQLPYIKGASNSTALGSTVQFLVGSMYNTPKFLTDGFYSISGTDGADLFWNSILSLGFGNQKITDVKIGDISIIKSEDGLSEGVHNKDSAQPMDADSLYYDDENLLEICQRGTEFKTSYFKQKISTISDGSEIVHEYDDESDEGEPIIKTLPDFVQAVEVGLQFNGLRYYNDSGDVGYWDERLVRVVPSWSNDNGETWHEFIFDGSSIIDGKTNSIKRNTNKTIRFIARHEFTSSESYGKTILIKVAKMTPELESNSNESAYLPFIQVYHYDNSQSSESSLIACSTVEDELVAKTTRIGLRLRSNSNTDGLLDEIHCLTCGLARTWNGSSWSTTKTATRNPSAWVLEILTSDLHPHSQYSDSEIDLDSFGELYEYCEDEEFYSDAILTKGQKKSDLINAILDTVNATMIINSEGKLEVVIDKAEENNIALLNAQDIISTSYSKDMSRKVDGAKITFTNRESWLVDTLYKMKTNKTRTADDTISEMNVDFITTSKHAQKYAHRKLVQAELQPKTITANVGREGDYYPLYKTVLVQLEQFRQGLRSSVISGLTKNSSGVVTAVKIQDSIVYDSTKRYGAIVQHITANGKTLVYLEVKAESDGLTRELVLTNGSDAISIGDTVSLGYLNSDGSFDSVTNRYKIMGISPDGSEGYTLTLKDYNSAIYEYGTIPEYKSNLTTPPSQGKTIPTVKKLQGEKGDRGYSSYTIQLFKRATASPSAPSGNLIYTFSTANLSGDLEGWSRSVPEVDDDNNPCWEVHATVTTVADSITINSWSVPVLVLKDSNLTLAEVQGLINDNAPPPQVSSDVTYCGFSVDDNSVAPISQSVTATIKVLQTNEELGFEFGTVSLPDGFDYTIDGNKITITVKSGTVVSGGSFNIPVLYRAYKSNITYIDEENGSYYLPEGTILGSFDNVENIPTDASADDLINWTGVTTSSSLAKDGKFEENTTYRFNGGTWETAALVPYGYYEYEDKITQYVLGIGYSQIKGGRYCNSANSLDADIFSDVHLIGDYFTWTGANISTELSADGQFLGGCVYAWNGLKWDKDESLAHNSNALSDVLKVANDTLKQNNSVVTAFFDRVVSNEVITSRLVAKQGFIDEIASNQAIIKQIQSTKIEVSNVNGLEDELGEKVDTSTIIEGGKIKTSLIDADAITADSVKTEDITSGSGTFTGLKADEGEFTNCKVSGSFVSNGGYRYNNVISFDAPINLNTVINTVLSKFPGYTGYIHCYCELQYSDGSTIYRCFGNVIKVNATDEQFTITGYGCYASNEMYKFNAGFTKSGLWITIGQTNLYEPEYTSLTIYY